MGDWGPTRLARGSPCWSPSLNLSLRQQGGLSAPPDAKPGHVSSSLAPPFTSSSLTPESAPGLPVGFLCLGLEAKRRRRMLPGWTLGRPRRAGAQRGTARGPRNGGSLPPPGGQGQRTWAAPRSSCSPRVPARPGAQPHGGGPGLQLLSPRALASGRSQGSAAAPKPVGPRRGDAPPKPDPAATASAPHPPASS